MLSHVTFEVYLYSANTHDPQLPSNPSHGKKLDDRRTHLTLVLSTVYDLNTQDPTLLLTSFHGLKTVDPCEVVTHLTAGG